MEAFGGGPDVGLGVDWTAEQANKRVVHARYTPGTRKSNSNRRTELDGRQRTRQRDSRGT